jgi:hypothetical protein
VGFHSNVDLGILHFGFAFDFAFDFAFGWRSASALRLSHAIKDERKGHGFSHVIRKVAPPKTLSS